MSDIATEGTLRIGREEKGVTRAESILYGDKAKLVRRLGITASDSDQAAEFLTEALRDVRAADQHEMSKVNPSPQMNERGESPEAIWLERVYGRVWELRKMAGEVFTEIAGECLEREHRRRRNVDSLPIGSGSVGAEEVRVSVADGASVTLR